MVTGGAGFIGSHVVDALRARDSDVIVVDDLSTGKRSNLAPHRPAIVSFAMDVRDGDIRRLVLEHRPEAIIHLAAQGGFVERSLREPAYDAGVAIIGLLNVLEAAKLVGSRIVFSSTGGALYGDADIMPTPEEYPARPVSPYGIAKQCCEQYLEFFHKAFGLEYVALRFSNVYGPRQNPDGEAGVVAIFTKRLLEGKPCLINGDGLQTRDYTYVADIVRAVILALDAGSGAYNVGTGRQTDVLTIYRLLADRLGVTASAQFSPPVVEQRTSALDCQRIRNELKWRPEVPVEEGLERTVSWFKEQLANV
jgi:UDP-glucose 4-epimerase